MQNVCIFAASSPKLARHYIDAAFALGAALAENGIGSEIHYPIPPHLSEAYRYLGYHEGDFPITEKNAREVLSLPMFNGLREDEQAFVIDTINRFRP